MDNIVAKKIDKSQVKKHFTLLGRQPNEIFIRAINDKHAVKTRGNNFNSLQTLNDRGNGIYYVVNPGGHSDNEITAGCAIFYEHDNLSKGEQMNLWWEVLNLPEPTFQVDTGGKSIHSYWVFQEPINISEWVTLQTDLLEFADADRSIKNPSRVMRLAGCYHQKTGLMAKIVGESGKKYNYDELRAIIPSSQKEKITPPIIFPPVNSGNDIPPLQIFLSKQNRGLLNGVPEGARNTSGCRLAKDLFGAETRLKYLGINCSESAENLIRDYASRCTPPLEGKEIDYLIKWASKNPEPSLNDEMLMNCYKGFLSRNRKPADRVITTNQDINQVASTPPEDKTAFFKTLKSEVKYLLDQDDLTPAELTVHLSDLAKKFNCSEMLVEKIYKAFLQEQERADQIAIANEQIGSFFKNSDAKITCEKFLPPRLTVITKLAEYMGLKPEVALLVLMTTASSLLKPGSRITLLDKTDFWQPLFCYGAIVANPGQRKSPLIRTICKQPLAVLQQRAKETYDKELLKWKEIEKIAIENKTEPPPAPVRPMFFLEGFTQEALRDRVSLQPQKGMLLLFDELSAETSTRNQYRGGKGADKQDYLTRYDGYMRAEIRGKGEVVSESQPIQLPILGGIQPGVLAKLLGDNQDMAGEFARLTIAIQPDSPMFVGDDQPSLHINDLLVGFYEKLAGLPILNLKLSPDAKKAFIKIHDALERQRCKEEHPAIKGALSKIIGQIGRYAGIFHSLGMVENNLSLSEEVSLETLNLAIEFARWQMAQIRTLYSQSDGLTGLLLKIMQISSRKGWIKSRDVVQSIRTQKLTSSEVRENFRSLAQMGFGEIRGSGINIEFCTKQAEPPEPIAVSSPPPEPPPEPEVTEAIEIIDEELEDLHFVESQLLSDEEAIAQETWERENNPHLYEEPKPDSPFKRGDRVEIIETGDRGEVMSIDFKKQRAFIQVDEKAKNLFYCQWESWAGLVAVFIQT